MIVKPIGIIHSPFKSKKDTPIQPFKSKAIGNVEIFKKYEKGLRDIEGFSHLILVYRFHLLNRRNNILTVKGIDTLDNTPFLDIKPYVPEFATMVKVKVGWLKGKLKRKFKKYEKERN